MRNTRSRNTGHPNFFTELFLSPNKAALGALGAETFISLQTRASICLVEPGDRQHFWQRNHHTELNHTTQKTINAVDVSSHAAIFTMSQCHSYHSKVSISHSLSNLCQSHWLRDIAQRYPAELIGYLLICGFPTVCFKIAEGKIVTRKVASKRFCALKSTCLW